MKIFKSYFFKIFSLIFISLFSLEFIFKLVEFESFGLEFLRIGLFTFVFSLIMAFFTTFFKEGGKFLTLFFIFLSTLYALVQMNFKNFMGNYMSFAVAGDGAGRIGEQVKTFVFSIKPYMLTLFIPFLIVLILVLVKKEWFVYEKVNLKVRIGLLCFIILVYFSVQSTLNIKAFNASNQLKTDKELYENPTLIDLSLKRFGVVRYLYLDLINMNSNKVENIVDVPVEVPVVIPSYEREIDDTDFLSIIQNEKKSNILDLHNFYINQNITSKNEMTGLFKDNNLIYIMVEAFDMMAIDEKLTPTLYKLSKEGMYFDNFYSPKYSCTTGESEYIGLTSIIPSLSVCTPNTYKDNFMPTSVFSLFKDAGYYGTSYHNYSDKFYERRTVHENMGAVKYYNNSDLNIKPIKGWPSDLNLMEEAIPKFINEDKFFSFIVTSTMHFPYNEDGHMGVVVKHWDKVKDLPYSDKVKRYKAKAIEFDLAMEYLLDELEKSGKLDTTTIAIFGDHHPLNMEFKYIDDASAIDRRVDFNMDRLPFIIYNSKVDGKVISDVGSTFDILPTIANLFDLEYDPRYYVGKDLFSEEEQIVIFASGSWMTDKALYNASKGSVKYFSSVDDDYVKNVNARVKNYFNVSNQTLTLDYFKYRFPN